MKKVVTCRVCQSDKLEMYLDLGLMPLANNLNDTQEQALNCNIYPLEVLFCHECGLSQLSVVIEPEKLYSYYTYRSSINGGYVKHCREMAVQLKNKYNLTKDSFHIDIAGNDGALLKQFKEEINHKVLNIDPAQNLCKIAELKNIDSICGFWGLDMAEMFFMDNGEVHLITATNVFAHVDNIKEFLEACKIVLKQDGILVLEFPYLIDFIENMEFDTIYFEHLSYFSLIPILRLCNITAMKVISAEKQKIHGGSLRVTITHEESSLPIQGNVSYFVNNELEKGYGKIETYKKWAIMVSESIRHFKESIISLKEKGNTIAAFAASAKGNTLLNSAKIDCNIIDYIADETPEKIGKYSPITGIPIVDKQLIIDNPPDYLIILSWNFRQEIMQKLNKIYKGKYLIPIPTLECSYFINAD